MLSLAVLLTLSAQSAPMFPFVIPWDDATKHTATDVSFLNASPAGAHGFILPKDGHFVESKTGQRIRFFGTNLAGAAAFPTHEDAIKVAAHLAKLGINIVRMHHLQNNWEYSIWNRNRMYMEFNPEAVDRLDYFVSVLEKAGIYVNMNLQTTRVYTPEMGFADSVSQIPDYDKRIDKVDPKMIQLQKDYARSLLGRTNPYTGLTYAQDPGIAVVEINNENSLVGAPWGNVPGGGLETLPEPFRGEVVAKWNAWLTAKYGTTEQLRKAWTDHSDGDDNRPLPMPTWTFENSSNGDVTFAPDPEAGAGATTAAPLRVTIKSNDGPDWHVQAHLVGLNLKEGASYTVVFRAKMSQDNSITLGGSLDQADWHGVGLWKTVQVGPAWRDYRVFFRATQTVPDHCRVGFMLGAARGILDIENLRVLPGIQGSAIPAGASLESHNIPLADGGLAKESSDYLRFLTDTETAYSTEMRRFLREDLGLHANLIDTQISWGGLTGLTREKESDFADNHAYWQHPDFPHRPWDAVDWHIENTPMVNVLDKDGGTLADLAMYRVAGKPYSISEYNHPSPSDYRAEMMPIYATFAADQDWDIIYTFAYGNTASGQDNSFFPGFFDVATDPSRTAFFPQAALIFRQGRITPAPLRALTVPQSDPWVDHFAAGEAWKTRPDLFANRLAVTQGGAQVEAPATNPALKLSRNSQGAIYTAEGANAFAIAGFVGGQVVNLSGFHMTFPAFGNGFAGCMAATKSGESLDKAPILLSLIGRVENQGMVWNATRTSVGDQWGHGPVSAEGIPCHIEIDSTRPRQVWALDPQGAKGMSVPTQFENGKVTFDVGPRFRTLWYEID